MRNKNDNLKLIDASFGMNYTYSIEELWLNPYNYLMMAKNNKKSIPTPVGIFFALKCINLTILDSLHDTTFAQFSKYHTSKQCLLAFVVA